MGSACHRFANMRLQPFCVDYVYLLYERISAGRGMKLMLKPGNRDDKIQLSIKIL